ncbi:tRNA (adenosine(37)-N6)-threonylcarbamoyltransferase complex ATPase subunit type 1 TsaE [Virgibacillus sp. MSJ-26]|uniref:tRNA (adenosine(37)-N6)-threonylcarbamoyltransferase complex ATPase subunit type 1 TsaE n=1 Tax=Virgibacillus sp. MSJ-26 TaxID=2841522 RepID=UPI001C115D1C|nr:tRNA (adenosine(37)-N6)-threonylcarbamoyltransferase complex ATPase subunit type 1 TsaE [Virgibacillus sp. MSJ-26]MBU5466940.1 tRNA (adenosine(37)-N6)-threonylcarbamoyltransferase complex ATPase subunit type 1 TsaE [Virgibacillus sp. MSJ-26]
MSETYKIETHTELETNTLAKRLALLLKAGDVITLEGDLGAGKTTFTKGLAQGLGIKRTVSSPTFTIVKEYSGELPLYHMDVYRLENSDEDIGFDEYFHGNGITVIEWAQFIEEYLPKNFLNINITYVDEHTRAFEFMSVGSHYADVINELKRL